MAPQPNPIQQSNVPGITVGDVSNDNTLPEPSPAIVVTTQPAGDGQVPVFTGKGPQATPGAGGDGSPTAVVETPMLGNNTAVGSGAGILNGLSLTGACNGSAAGVAIVGAGSSVLTIPGASSAFAWSGIPADAIAPLLGLANVTVVDMSNPTTSWAEFAGENETSPGDTTLAILLSSMAPPTIEGDDLTWNSETGELTSAAGGTFLTIVNAQTVWL